MRELAVKDLEVVSGGLAPPTNLHPRMDARIAVESFKGWGVLGSAFGLGYTIGSWLNDNTPVQAWIADGLDALAGTNYNNQAGVRYQD